MSVMLILPCAGDPAQWEMAIGLNLTAPILLTKAFAAGMVKNKVCKLALCKRLLLCTSTNWSTNLF